MQSQAIDVDLHALTTLQHECTGCSKDKQSCCAHYDICIRKREMQQIIGYLPQAATFCPQLKTADGFDNVFEEVERNLFRIDTLDDERCTFAYDLDHETRCSLHTIALDHDLPINTLKPEACLLWPLALSETQPLALSIHKDALQFPCNHLRPQQENIHSSVDDILETVFGHRFAQQVHSAVESGAPSIRLHR